MRRKTAEGLESRGWLMGTGSVARDAAVSVLNRGLLEKGNHNAQWWTSEVLGALGGAELWTRVGLRQMSGVVLLLFCRTQLAPHVGELSSTSVACGVMGVGGNKGGVALHVSVFRRRFVFLTSHFAAHQEKVDERNADYAKIARLLRFKNTALHVAGGGQGEGDEVLVLDAREVSSVHGAPDPEALANSSSSSLVLGEGLRDAELVVWMGDFNYRINQSYEHVVDCANQGLLRELLPLDQMRQEAARGNIFHGLYEVPPPFPPTYKFDKGLPTVRGRALPYDSSEKRRIPAWTDRVLWRGSVASGAAPAPPRADHVVAVPRGPEAYMAMMEVCDSDHKPVLLELELKVPGYEEQTKRRAHLQLLRALADAEEAAAAAPGGTGGGASLQLQVQGPHSWTALPRSSLSGSSAEASGAGPSAGSQQAPLVQLDAGGQVEVLVMNVGVHALVVRAAGYLRDSPCLPSWLEVLPTSLVLEPGQRRSLRLHAVNPDIMQPQKYPLEAAVQLLAERLGAAGSGALRRPRQQQGGAVVCVEVR